jgi:hypothetical protein
VGMSLQAQAGLAYCGRRIRYSCVRSSSGRTANIACTTAKSTFDGSGMGV